MAYNNDRHIRLGSGEGTTAYDSFDPLLVNLHDSVNQYKINKNQNDADMNDMTQAVIDILDANLSATEKVLSSDILVELIKQA